MKETKDVVGLQYNGMTLPYTITIDGKVYDNNEQEVTVMYNARFGYRIPIILNGKKKTISLARALLESFKAYEGNSTEVTVVYKDKNNSNISLSNLSWYHKTASKARSGSRLYEYNRSSMESALKILSNQTGTVESAVKQSRLTLEQIKEIVTSSKYRPVRSGYNIKLCKEKLFGN